MRVTAKMPADYIRSHWGEVKHPHFWSYETPYFGKNPGKSSEATFRALKSLVTLLGGGDKISTLPKNGKGSFRLSLDVNQQKTRKFLDSYMSAFDASNTTLSAVRLRAILDHWSDAHAWNIAFHTPSNKAVKNRLDVRGLDLGLVQRTTEDENQLDSQSFNHPTTMPLSIWNLVNRELTLCSSFTVSIQILSGERNQRQSLR